MNYILKRFLMETTLRCTWKLTQGEGRTNVHIAMQCIEEVLTNSSPKPQFSSTMVTMLEAGVANFHIFQS